MSDLKTLSIRVAVLKALLDRVTETDQITRADLIALMKETGAEKTTAELPDGTKVASVSLAGGTKVRARVVDEDAFFAWVKQHRPGEVVEKVRDSYRKAVLDDAAATGEDIPGVEIGTASVYVSNRFKPGGKDAITQAWAAGELALPELLAITAGGDAA